MKYPHLPSSYDRMLIIVVVVGLFMFVFNSYRTGKFNNYNFKNKSVFIKVTAVFFIFILCAALWVWAYTNRNNIDNIPAKNIVAQMDEADINSLFPGYKIDRLKEVWGEPNEEKNNEAVWLLNETTKLIVNFKNNSEISVCGLIYIE